MEITKDRIVFEGTNFFVVDLRPEIDKIRGAGFPRSALGTGPAHTTTPRKKDHVNLHQSYGQILVAEKGPIATANFVTASPKYMCKQCSKVWLAKPSTTTCPNNHPGKSKRIGGGRGFPKMSYHIWAPYYALIHKAKFVLFLCLDLDERSWQGGGSNESGVAVVVQGRHYSRHMGKKFRPWPNTNGTPSVSQKASIPMMLEEYLFPTIGVPSTEITGHFDWGKPACPGDYFETYVRQTRGEKFNLPKVVLYKKDDADHFDTWAERQQALWVLGFDLGDTGPDKSGVDGYPGEQTKGAIEAFEEEYGLVQSGWWGEQVEEAIKQLFYEDGIVDHRVTYRDMIQSAL